MTALYFITRFQAKYVLAVDRAARLRLRHREREHPDQRRGGGRRVRRREGDGRRPRVRLRRVEGVHAPRHRHHQLLRRHQARAGHQV